MLQKKTDGTNNPNHNEIIRKRILFSLAEALAHSYAKDPDLDMDDEDYVYDRYVKRNYVFILIVVH